MDAKGIAAIVGTERKPWWPRDIAFDGMRWNQGGNGHKGLDYQIVEAAFIGAAVKWLIATVGFRRFCEMVPFEMAVSGMLILPALVAACKSVEASA